MNVQAISQMDRALKHAELRAEWAKRARTDPIAFIEFIIRTEKIDTKTGQQKRIKLAEMQEEMVEFCLKHRRGVIKASPKVGKSHIITLGLTLWLAGKDASFRCALGSLKQDFALFFTGAIMEHVEHNEDLHLVFPHMKPAEGKWSREKLYLDRGGARVVHPTWRAVGANTGQQGTRVIVNVLDDIQDKEHTDTELLSDKTLGWIYAGESRMDKFSGDMDLSDYTFGRRGYDDVNDEPDEDPIDFGGSISPVGTDIRFRSGYRWLITNALQPYDAAHKLVADDGWALLEACVADKDGKTRLPAVYTQSDIDNYSKVSASRDLYCKTRLPGEQLFREAWIHAGKILGKGLRLRPSLDVATIALIRNEGGRIICGVDLASRKNKKSDHTVFYVALIATRSFFRRWLLRDRYSDMDSLLPPNARMTLPLWIERRKMHSPEIRTMLYDINDRFHPDAFVVEDNGCFPAGTLVLTSTGYRDIVEVAVGDVVLTHKGRWRTVTNTTTRLHSGVLTDIKPTGGVRILCTPNHGFWSRASGRVQGARTAINVGKHRPQGAPEWRAAENIRGGGNGEAHYLSLPLPKWPAAEPVLRLVHRGVERDVQVTEQVALMLGLYLAEGHSTLGQVTFTLNESETHIHAFLHAVAREVFGALSRQRKMTGKCVRVVMNSTALARVTRLCGKSSSKFMPWEWMGWPLATRVAFVRGWLMGDGSVQQRNGKNKYLTGTTISRNLALQVRATLLELGMRPQMDVSQPRESVIDGRVLHGRHCKYRIEINGDDSDRLLAMARTDVEVAHWSRHGTPLNHQREAGSGIVHDDGAWTLARKVTTQPFVGQVFNLEVEEDESYVVEDVAVHNSQAYIRQDVMVERRDIPVFPFVTGPLKSDAERGVEGGLTNDLAAGLTIIPSMPLESSPDTLVLEPEVEQWVTEMRDFTKGAHTGDTLMASWFVREFVFSHDHFMHQIDVAGVPIADDELRAMGFTDAEIQFTRPTNPEFEAMAAEAEAEHQESQAPAKVIPIDAAAKEAAKKAAETERRMMGDLIRRQVGESAFAVADEDDPEIADIIASRF